MQFTQQELIDLVEAVGTRITYLRKMCEPEMGVQPQLVVEAEGELERMNELHLRLSTEFIRVKG